MLPGSVTWRVPAGVHYGSCGRQEGPGVRSYYAQRRGCRRSQKRERPPDATGGRPSTRSLERGQAHVASIAGISRHS